MTATQAVTYLLSSFAIGYGAGWLVLAFKRVMEIASS